MPSGVSRAAAKRTTGVSPAIRRCYRSMSAAQTSRRRGIQGARSDVYLDPTVDLAVIKCRDATKCECARWPGGHNAATLPVKQPRKLLVCERCGKGRTGRCRGH